MLTDTPQTLLRRIAEFAEGDDAAEWSAFVELYEPVIRLYIAQLGSVREADIDDIVQDIFARLVDVLRNEDYKPEKGRFRYYLAAMVRRLLIDRHRREMVRPDRVSSLMPISTSISQTSDDIRNLPQSLEDHPSSYADSGTMVDMRLALARHQAAIKHVLGRTMLEKRTVAAYREYALEEQPAAEVAARHDITVNNLRQLKHRIDRMIAAVEAAYGE